MSDEKSPYDFAILGEKIADVLLRVAEDQVTEAQNLLASTKALAEGIRAQVGEQSRLLDDLNQRLKTFGTEAMEAHKKFLNGAKEHGNGK
jgi:hypothetical protein